MEKGTIINEPCIKTKRMVCNVLVQLCNINNIAFGDRLHVNLQFHAHGRSLSIETSAD